jgi:hypothetical protein
MSRGIDRRFDVAIEARHERVLDVCAAARDAPEKRWPIALT